MKTLLLLILALPPLAQAQSTLMSPMFHILSGAKQLRGTDQFSVKVSQETSPERLRNGNTRVTVEGETYRRARELVRSVLTAVTQDDRVRDQNQIAMGTGFHVGGNLVLTNRHVLSPNQVNWTRCGDLVFKTYDGKSMKCERVVYCEPNPGCSANTTGCSRTPDFCLIAVHGKLSNYPSLPLSSAKLMASTSDAYATIGNSGGFGLHFSESRGMRPVNEWKVGVNTQAFHGNSGGPLINEANEVVGVLYQRNHSIETFAVGMDWMLRRLEQVLGQDHPAWKTISGLVR